MSKTRSIGNSDGFSALERLGEIFSGIDNEFRRIFQKRRNGEIPIAPQNSPEYKAIAGVLENIKTEAFTFQKWLTENGRRTLQSGLFNKFEELLNHLIELNAENFDQDYEKIRLTLLRLQRLFKKYVEQNFTLFAKIPKGGSRLSSSAVDLVTDSSKISSRKKSAATTRRRKKKSKIRKDKKLKNLKEDEKRKIVEQKKKKVFEKQLVRDVKKSFLTGRAG